MRILSTLLLASLIACSTTDSLTGPTDPPPAIVQVPTRIYMSPGVTPGINQAGYCPVRCRTQVSYIVTVYDQNDSIIKDAGYQVDAPGATYTKGEGTLTVKSNSGKRVTVSVSLPIPKTNVMLVDPINADSAAAVDTIQFIPDLNDRFSKEYLVTLIDGVDSIIGHINFPTTGDFTGSMFVILAKDSDQAIADTFTPENPNFAYSRANVPKWFKAIFADTAGVLITERSGDF